MMVSQTPISPRTAPSGVSGTYPPTRLPFAPAAREIPPLWPHQTETLDVLRGRFASGQTRVILCAPTGAGKTRMAGEICRSANALGNQVAFVAPLLTLVDQSVRALEALGLEVGRLQGSNTRNTDAPTVVCSAQTLASRYSSSGNTGDFGGSGFNPKVALIDECHVTHKGVKEWLDMEEIDAVGLTATPFGPYLSSFWNGIVSARTTNRLIEDGYLVPAEVWCCHEMDLQGVKVANTGEYVLKEIVKRAIPIVGDIVGDWEKRCITEGRRLKTIVFSARVDHGELLKERFQKAGHKFEQISYLDSANREEREAKIEGLRRGELDGLISVDALAKGFDIPDIDCVIVARPIRASLATHIQILGRGLRSAPGKTKCIVHDHCGNYARLCADTEEFFENGMDELEEAKAKAAPSPKQTERQCEACGFFNPLGAKVCESCGAPLKSDVVAEVSGSLKILSPEERAASRKTWRNQTHPNVICAGFAAAIAERRKVAGPDELIPYQGTSAYIFNATKSFLGGRPPLDPRRALEYYHELRREWPDYADQMKAEANAEVLRANRKYQALESVRKRRS